MSVINRPYAGLWGPNKTKIVQHSPDALVYLNGDTSLPACNVCKRNVDVQPLVTSITVDAGVDPGSHSATINLSFPKKIGDEIFRDGASVLRPALEVHVYMRGYFPIAGLPTNAAPDLRSQSGSDIDLSAIPQYPYYLVFHGVVTNVSLEYSGGFYSSSLSCNSMLHFWSFQNLSTNASVFGIRPTNSGLKRSLRGNYYSGMSPYGIIYTLYKDTIGAADGDGLVSFALSTATNFNNKSLAEDESLFSMAIRYWEKRFSQGPYKLRMHGVNGQLLSTAQQAFFGRLGRLGSSGARINLYQKFISTTDRKGSDTSEVKNPYRALFGAQYTGDSRLNRNQDFLFLLGNSGSVANTHGVSPEFFEVIVKDLSQFGAVNMFEGTYETKLNMAEMAAKVSGFEFYQDVDGDLVFKPPLFNLDTKPSRVYNLKPEDIISISFTEGEPEATYITCRNAPFRNFKGVIDETEWGKKGQYVDYRLVAQFGFRPTSLETSYYNNAKSAFYAAVARLDIINSNVNGASVTIPLRTELRPGYPVYIPHVDCYYYISSISHSFTFGSQCTTSLTLTARRRKFHGPRALNSENKEGPYRVDLSATYRPPEILRGLDNENQPKTVGFPNVVMAMDYENLNPFSFFLSNELENLGDEKSIDQLIQLLKKANLIKSVSNGEGPSLYSYGEDTVTKEELYIQGKALIAVEGALKSRSVNKKAKAKLRTSRTARRVPEELGFGVVEKSLQGVDFKQLLQMYEQVKKSFLKESGLTDDYYAQTSGILDILSDKKSSFAQDHYGYYRYYSSSHPDPDMQGPKQPDNSKVTVDTAQAKSFLTPSVLKPLSSQNPLMYLAPAEKKVFVSRVVVDTNGVKRGLKIDRSVLKQSPSPDFTTPTHDILTLSFQTVKVKSTRRILESSSRNNTQGLSLPTLTLKEIVTSNKEPSIRDAAVFENIPPGIANKALKFKVSVKTPAFSPAEVNSVSLEYANKQRAQSKAYYMTKYNAAKGDDTKLQELDAEYQNDIKQFGGPLRGGVNINRKPVVQTKERSVQSPVFPVSDNQGYEVIGSYQYGRGLRIEPGGNYETLMKLDPFYYVTPEARNLFEVLINQILQESFTKIDDAPKTLSELNLNLPAGGEVELIKQLEEQSLNPSNREAFDVLSISPEDFKGTDEDDRVSMIKQRLRNFIFDENSSVSKLTVTNAAIALSDIKPVRVEESCTFCQSGSADVQLDAFSDPNKFILIDTENIQERAMGALAETMVGKSVDWKVRQNALRGQVQDRGRNNIWESVTGDRGLVDSYERLFGGETTQQENLRLSEEAERLRNLLNGEED